MPQQIQIFYQGIFYYNNFIYYKCLYIINVKNLVS